jgi:hypothetical protein
MAKLLWTQKQDIGPNPRVLHALAFDSTAARTILFGGDSLSGPSYGDTWAWDGDNWTQIADIGPHPRAAHALAYDSARNRIVLFGGTVGGASVRDTWEWGDDAWTQVADTGPSVRSGHAMVFDSARGRCVLFGGGPFGGAPLNDTWEWDGNDWVQVEDTGPSPRRAHAMAFDSARNRVVLFGGFGNPGPAPLGDTWEYNAAAPGWTQVQDIGPEACFNSALVFKTARSELFGGTSALGNAAPPPKIFDFSWEWDGAHWTARQDIGPGPRVGHAMAYDSVRDRVVLFGGAATALDDPAGAAVALGDTWEQFEAGAIAGGGGGGPTPPPAGDEQPLEQFAVIPDVAEATPGNQVVFEVVLAGPAGPAGQDVDISIGGSSIGAVSVPAGSTTTDLPVDVDILAPIGNFIQFDATAGGVTLSATLTIV